MGEFSLGRPKGDCLIEVKLFPILFSDYFGTLITDCLIDGGYVMKIQLYLLLL